MSHKELQRLQAVQRFLKLEISREKELQDIVALAAAICRTPVALIALVDERVQYSRFKVGTEWDAIQRELAFCNQVITTDDTVMIPDTLNDVRFTDNCLITANAHVRFYAGAPLRTHDGVNLGSLCVVDIEPNQLNSDQVQMLEVLSRQVINILEFDLTLHLLKEQFVEAKSSEIKLRSFFDSSNAIHVLIGRELDVLAFNKPAFDFVKTIYKIELRNGMKATDYINEELVQDFVSNYRNALAGEAVQVQRQISYGAAGKIWWDISYNPAYNGEGEIIGVSFTCADINDRKTFEQKIIHQNALLKKIAHVQSHEFRRPVASILGLMNVIKLEGKGDHTESLEMMEAAVHELDEKIHDIVNTIYTPDLLSAH